jgi:putative transposase
MSKCMQSLNRGYTAYYNNQYQMVGHLWQGRFKSKPILKGAYLINCATYIEYNPVRAGIVQDPANYLWSSYRERCLIAQKDMLDEIRVVSLSNTDMVPLSALEL